MSEFTQAVSGWETFYMLVGTAAVTLVGLLFVAISINIESFRRKGSVDLQLFATVTFNCFFYVLMIAILFLVPGQSPLGLGLPLLAVGGLGSVNTISQQRRARKVQHSALHPDIAQRFTGPLISMSLLTICAAGLLFGMLWSLLGLVVVVILLLASASQNAWTLLVVVGRQES